MLLRSWNGIHICALPNKRASAQMNEVLEHHRCYDDDAFRSSHLYYYLHVRHFFFFSSLPFPIRFQHIARASAFHIHLVCAYPATYLCLLNAVARARPEGLRHMEAYHRANPSRYLHVLTTHFHASYRALRTTTAHCEEAAILKKTPVAANGARLQNVSDVECTSTIMLDRLLDCCCPALWLNTAGIAARVVPLKALRAAMQTATLRILRPRARSLWQNLLQPILCYPLWIQSKQIIAYLCPSLLPYPSEQNKRENASRWNIHSFVVLRADEVVASAASQKSTEQWFTRKRPVNFSTVRSKYRSSRKMARQVCANPWQRLDVKWLMRIPQTQGWEDRGVQHDQSGQAFPALASIRVSCEGTLICKSDDRPLCKLAKIKRHM